MAQVLLELCKLTVNRNGKAHEDSGKFRDLFWASDPSRSELQNLIGLDIFWSNPTTLEHEMLNCWTCMKNILIKATWALYIETYMLDQQKNPWDLKFTVATHPWRNTPPGGPTLMHTQRIAWSYYEGPTPGLSGGGRPCLGQRNRGVVVVMLCYVVLCLFWQNGESTGFFLKDIYWIIIIIRTLEPKKLVRTLLLLYI